MHVLHVGSLETINALVIITHYKYIWFVPVIDQQFNQPVLCSAGILVFIHQYILETVPGNWPTDFYFLRKL